MKVARDKPMVTTVGYGLSEWLRPGFEPTDERRVADGELMHVLASQLLLSQVYSQGKSDQAKKNEGSCFGDSGGPAIHGGDIVGVTSWGDAVCVSTGFYYRVDTQAVQDWLASELTD